MNDELFIRKPLAVFTEDEVLVGFYFHRVQIKVNSQSPQMTLMFGLAQMLVLHSGHEYLTLFFGLGGVGLVVSDGLLLSLDS